MLNLSYFCSVDYNHIPFKYRLRVSRRIAAFAGILRRLLKHSEATTPSNRLKLQSLHRFYMERLMRLVLFVVR